MFLTAFSRLSRSELTSLDTSILLEVWEKGLLWDKAIGYYWTPLQHLQCCRVVSTTTESAFFAINCVERRIGIAVARLVIKKFLLSRTYVLCSFN